MTYEFRIDEGGYIYLLDRNGRRVDVLVDVPNCSHYGKLKLGEPIKEADG